MKSIAFNDGLDRFELFRILESIFVWEIELYTKLFTGPDEYKLTELKDNIETVRSLIESDEIEDFEADEETIGKFYSKD